MSGFANTGAPSDEGQHLQTIYPTARVFGGPGRFGFDKASFIDDQHPLATLKNSEKLFLEWSNYWDLTKRYLLEQSPPNLVRTRFLQKIFPNSRFIIILRHPIAVAYATMETYGNKMGRKFDIPCLIEHSLCCYERFRKDMHFLNMVYVIRYEDFILEPHRHVQVLLEWIGVEPFEFQNNIQTNFNDKYFTLWNLDRHSLSKKLFGGFAGLSRKLEKLEKRANEFGYSMNKPENLLPISWFRQHNN